MFSLVEQLELEEEVIFTDYFPEDEMPALYALADAFACCSMIGSPPGTTRSPGRTLAPTGIR